MLPYYIICAVIGYLIGSIPFGYIIVKVAKGIDIRTVGSGNIGATNVARVMGWPAGLLVFILDATKGIGAILLSSILMKSLEIDINLKKEIYHSAYYLWSIGGLSAIIGHLFPIWLKFRGGKGVATTLGVFFFLMLPLNSIPFIIVLCVWIGLFILFKYVSLSSIGAMITMPVAFLISTKTLQPVILIFLLIAFLVIIKHISNIKRLINGTEPKVNLWKRRTSSS